MVAGVTRNSLAPWIPDDLEFYPHQIEGVRQLNTMNSFLLADEMGLGKSLQALTVFAIDCKLGVGNKMLVVCPVTLLENWADEIQMHTGFSWMILGEEPEVIDSKGHPKSLTKAQRSAQIADFATWPEPSILIANYEKVAIHLQELNTIPWQVKCFDEAHYLQNPKAKRTKACMAIRARRVFELTGSPMLNQANGLWTLLHMISPGEFPSYWRFVNRFCLFGGFQDKQIVGVKNEAELTRRMSSHMVRRLKKDHLNLQAPEIIKVKIGLTDLQRELYDQIVEDEMLDLPNDPSPMEIENALTKFLRLKQICGTTATIDGYEDSSLKLDRAVEIIKELTDNDHKVVVFTQFRRVLACLEERLEAAHIRPVHVLHGDVPQASRIPVVRAWGTSKGPGVLACMTQVAGVGLNMTQARYCIFIDKLFTPMLNKQAIDRLHRIGQSETQPVVVYELLCKGTIETRIEQILKTKDTIFGAVIEEAQYKRELVLSLTRKDDEEDAA